MSFEIEGKLHKVFQTEQKTDSFRAREFVIETMQGSFSQFIKFQLTQDRCEAIDAFREGTQVKVYFDLRGRQWQDKYFTNLQAWRVEAAGEAQPAPVPGQRQMNQEDHASSDQANAADSRMDDFDDLPF